MIMQRPYDILHRDEQRVLLLPENQVNLSALFVFMVATK